MHQQIPLKVGDARLSFSAGLAGSEEHIGSQTVHPMFAGPDTL